MTSLNVLVSVHRFWQLLEVLLRLKFGVHKDVVKIICLTKLILEIQYQNIRGRICLLKILFNEKHFFPQTSIKRYRKNKQSGFTISYNAIILLLITYFETCFIIILFTYILIPLVQKRVIFNC